MRKLIIVTFAMLAGCGAYAQNTVSDSFTLQPENEKLTEDKRISDLCYRYLTKAPAFKRTKAPSVKNAIISWPTASHHLPAFFDGQTMPVPDIIEWRCPIYSFLRPDSSINSGFLETAIAEAEKAGVQEIQISMILSNNNDKIPGLEQKNIDEFFAAMKPSLIPEKMIDSVRNSVEKGEDNSECRNNRYLYSYHSQSNIIYVNESIKAITHYFKTKESGRKISVWHFRAPGNNDWWYPINSRFYDYSDSAKNAFRKYLKNKYENLDKLNRRCGSDFKDWNEIEFPLPKYGQTNISAQWQDFQDFRSRSITEIQRGLYKSLRENDKEHDMTGWMTTSVYAASRDGIVLDYAALLNRECPGMLMALTWFDFYDFPGELWGQLSLQYEVKIAMEPGKNNMSSYLRTYYNCLRFPVQRINWLYVIPQKPEQYPWIIWVLNQRGVQEELAEAELVQEDIAQLFSYSDVILTVPEKLWDKQIIANQVSLFRALQNKNYNLPIFTDYTSEVKLDKYKAVILPETKLIRAEMIDKLASYVKDGGTLILAGECAVADLNNPENKYPLFQALGIDKNAMHEDGIVKCGSGRIILKKSVNSLLEKGELTAETEKLLKDVGAKHSLSSDKSGIASFIKKKGNTYYLGFINTKNSAASAQFKFQHESLKDQEAVEMISGDKIFVKNGKFQLDFQFQWEIKVLKLEVEKTAFEQILFFL